MKITRQKENPDENAWQGWHILTVAEDGFSVLSFYGHDRNGLNTKVIKEFADRVNRTNESGGLHPHAPISAVPKRFFRDLSSTNDLAVLAEFQRHVSDFLAANASTIYATRLLVDFHVSPSPVPAQYLDATEDAIRQQPSDGILQEVVIIT